jgi:phosphoribosylanthranilate isomerase
MIHVKICGITSAEIAQKVCLLKADVLGFLVGFNKKEASNYITKEIAKEVVKMAKSFSKPSFLLTKSSDAETVFQTCTFIQNSHVQLLADISPDEIIILKKKLPHLIIVKVIHVMDEKALNLAKKYHECQAVDQLLLDSKVGNALGGTGQTHDWNISKRVVENSQKPVWLAGGLNPSNVLRAISIVKPHGVDVETGVQNQDGSKNYEMIKKFINKAHSY